MHAREGLSASLVTLPSRAKARARGQHLDQGRQATLKGEIPISGAKNAALTLMPCALLTDEKLTLTNLPRLADVDTFSHLLNQLGVSTTSPA